MDELEYKRDYQFPLLMETLHRLEVMLSVYSARSEENARRAKDYLFGVQNSRKARDRREPERAERSAHERLIRPYQCAARSTRPVEESFAVEPDPWWVVCQASHTFPQIIAR